ncbi:MAG: methylated-DNA--[protein]-cysteine S-methyltransferase [Erysipelotrichaceae bacterium]|nr:methylated-DNA--[protein]-cysteine S-methyltransferase [Erysipelotrichaceae bacterium]
MIGCVIQSPLGNIRIGRDDTGITELKFTEEPVSISEDELLCRCAQELEEYFLGDRTVFDLPLSLKGTEFQKKVWNILTDIPYGHTETYGSIALKAGNPQASRAVGSACHNNPVWIMIPCHRVIGKNGSLTGYAGGIDRKQKLLEMEKKNASGITDAQSHQ